MTLQKNNPDSTETPKISCGQYGYSAANQLNYKITVPEDKLAELQLKAAQRDELLKALELADDDIQYYGNSDFNKTLIEIRAAIAKAKGE